MNPRLQRHVRYLMVQLEAPNLNGVETGCLYQVYCTTIGLAETCGVAAALPVSRGLCSTKSKSLPSHARFSLFQFDMLFGCEQISKPVTRIPNLETRNPKRRRRGSTAGVARSKRMSQLRCPSPTPQTDRLRAEGLGIGVMG